MDPDKNRPETEVDAGSEKDNLEPTKGVKSKKKKGDNGDQDKNSERKKFNTEKPYTYKYYKSI